MPRGAAAQLRVDRLTSITLNRHRSVIHPLKLLWVKLRAGEGSELDTGQHLFFQDGSGKRGKSLHRVQLKKYLLNIFTILLTSLLTILNITRK
jgi:hypothetical protein